MSLLNSQDFGGILQSAIMFFFHGLSSDLIMHAWLINNLLRERRAMFLFKVVRMILYLYFHFSINPKIKLWLFQVTSREEMIIHIYAYIYMHIYVMFVYIYISFQYNYITFFLSQCVAMHPRLNLNSCLSLLTSEFSCFNPFTSAISGAHCHATL